jgi:phosphatidylglycerophosphate synthase
MSADAAFVPARRVHTSVLAAAEKRLLVWLAGRMPPAVNSDHLTALAALAMLATGVCFAVAPAYPAALLGVIAMLAVNWFGDSLDGTLARVRHQERPRYGYYVDHVLDAVGFIWLMGGLILGGYMSPVIGLGFVVAYFLLVIEVSLATHARGTFRISFWGFGPTELRIFLAAGTLMLLRSPQVAVFGRSWLLFDVGGIVAIAALFLTFAASSIKNGVALYREETIR